jgi:L-ribulose-5-phosphate 4-epimerase
VTGAPFRPTAESLLPELSPRQELVLLARTLWHEGYDDHLAGHITYRQPDGTLLCNPWLLRWEELRPEVVVAVHSHPRYATVWADLARVPGCYDQSSALGGGEPVVVDEYYSPVNSRDSAARAVKAMGQADVALLVNHGVFVTAGSIRAAHQRAVALEYRAWRAWHVESLGRGRELPEPSRSFFRASDGEGFIGFWEAMARRQLRDDPTLLDPL